MIYCEFERDLRDPPILYIPVPEPKTYFNAIKNNKEITFISENKFVGYDLEGFYILDNERNHIFFFRDYHGPYDANLWEWTWEI